jgi:predicted anti-sigma-YlaC factor YlaD
MNRCREIRNVQDYLDRELDAERFAAFERHLETCEACQSEIRAFRSLFDTLGDYREERAFLDPGPGLTERILDRVLPSRLRRRLVTVLGWIYGGSTAISTFAVVSWISRPESHVWLAQRYGEISLRALQSGLFAFELITRSWFEVLQGWGFLERMAGTLSPIARALARPLADPTLGFILIAATLACAVMLRWMHGQREPAEGARHVSLLGF